MTIPGAPLAGRWTRWVVPEIDVHRLRPPMPYGSAEFWREASEVVEVSRRLTLEHKRIADDWNLDLGTVTPAGVWNLKALELRDAARWASARRRACSLR